ncbi:MAG: LysR family transcriptional regulator [Achromobacter mucicolens]|jgi:DNA-binding transcriptional LysR family regulator|uniref:LysR family transcriptional regulator n=1 Tax=Achromobacter TaxID=222 RepID=UPI00114FBDE1|nr:MULTISPECIES: LysR family transcriptional regulator [Achromobacter]MDF2863467.1 LysR family transcriptional regulator [Achromobacter mucicolens]TQJ96961.1 DNA-binding transcriptional LysR family regulator [Achromobacter sp. SLBN-14]
MRDLDITTLRLFISVCETGNIARAGQRANIVGSAISKRLAQLEDTVGAKLLTRRRRGVEPTEAGETLLEHARAILASSERIERDMSAYASGVKGQVRILATASVLAESLAEDIAAFLQAAPHRNIRVDMEERVSHEVVRGVREGIASLGICWDAADFHGLEQRPYRGDRLAVVTAPGHPLAERDAVFFEEALAYEHVSMPAAGAVLRMLQTAASDSGKTLRHRVTVSNFDSAFRVVLAGLAISVAPIEVATPYALAHGLRVLPLKDTWSRRRFAICMRSASALPAAAALLLEHLVAAGANDNP